MIRGYEKRCEKGFEKRWDERRWGEALEGRTIFYNCTGFQVYAANPWFSEWAYQSESSRCLCCILCDLLRFEKGHFISPNHDSDTNKSMNSATGHDPTWSNFFHHALFHLCLFGSFVPRFKESMVNQNGHFSLWRRSSPPDGQVRDEGIQGLRCEIVLQSTYQIFISPAWLLLQSSS